MKVEIISVVLLNVFVNINALWCWHCMNARNTWECDFKGRNVTCRSNEETCSTELRRGPNGIQINKRCKQATACGNNVGQNDKAAWIPTQCNINVLSSVCRCCCNYDGCNFKGLRCYKERESCRDMGTPDHGSKICQHNNTRNSIGTRCKFLCDDGYRIKGARQSTCISNQNHIVTFDKQMPRCDPIPTLPPTCPRLRKFFHGKIICSRRVLTGSVCDFVCDDFFHILKGKTKLRCGETGRWNGIAPVCVAVSCPQLPSPFNGFVSCTRGFDEGSVCRFRCIKDYRVVGAKSSTCLYEKKRGYWSEDVPNCERKICSVLPITPSDGKFTCTDGRFANSECKFACRDHYGLVGTSRTKCVEEKGVMKWSHDSPKCEEIKCKEQTFLRNGVVNCTNANNAASVCTFECVTDGFHLEPATTISNLCLNNSTWNISKPCCYKKCPPYSVVDVAFLIDSSSSIGKTNFQTIIDFVKNLTNTFVIGPDAARIGVFRYNKNVDTKTQVLLNAYPNDKNGLLRAIDRIPYDGSGTNTGKALKHVKNVMLSQKNGNRPDVPDYVVVVTDGRSQDAVGEISRQLRDNNVRILAIGVTPTNGNLDLDQLETIVSSPEDLVVATTGFGDLNQRLFSKLVGLICKPGCL